MENELKKTCLHQAHSELGASMAPFAGYDMPIEYSGLDTEHTAVRTHAGVFDVSHMGEIFIEGPDAVDLVNHVFTGDAAALAPGAIVYGMMCRPDGGTVDDLLVYRLADSKFLLVVNASNIDKDYDWIKANADGYDAAILNRSADYGQLALQGPESETVLRDVLGIDAAAMKFYTFTALPGADDAHPMIVSRTGYTGEDGFEIYADEGTVIDMWHRLIDAGVTPCGLGCRDTLRFEAGLPLYGDELADDITPVEAGLSMFVKLDKPGGFIGRDALARQKTEGPKKRLVGLELEGAATARHGFEVLDIDGAVVGHVTTGYNSLTVGKNLAVALVDAAYAPLGTHLQVKIRRRMANAVVVKKRFYIPNYKK
ncbi:MAG: glycine cleavage system aminomethyltransferase GcvT [Muribaculaceae bacterium]|nr:glycine cleavage system aminomethyltransferase GcvT [Muribaculaceae bacterium]